MDAMAALEQGDAGLAAAGFRKAYGHQPPNVVSSAPFSVRWISAQGAVYAPEGGEDTLRGGEYGSYTAGTTTTTYYIEVFLGVAPVTPDWTATIHKTYPFERPFKNAYLQHMNIGRTCHSSRVAGCVPYRLQIGKQEWYGLLFTVRAHTIESTVTMGND